MPKAYTLTPRPKNLSTTATLIHRLRHPLRIQRIRHSSLLPSYSGSVRTEFDKRRPRVEDEWLEAPTSQGSPYEFVEIEDKGEYTEQRYGDVDVYWNSVMMEASEEEKARTKAREEKHHRRRGRVFEDSEQLYKAYRSRQRTKDSASIPTAVPKQTMSLPNPSPGDPALSGHVDVSHLPTHLDSDTSDDRYITLAGNTSVAELSTHRTLDADLTWNSALTRILASPCVDPEVSSTIRARARGRRLSRNLKEVDMKEVSMVPNFSYPITSARWCDACAASDWPFLDGDERGNRIGGSERDEHHPVELDISINGNNSDYLDLEHSEDADDDSLYRAPTPLQSRASHPGSILRDILDPQELEMYQEIMSHNPRFTVLLDRTENRQVPLVRNLCTMLEVLTKRLADFEECSACHDHKKEERAVGHEDICRALVKPEEDVIHLRRAVNFSNRVLDGCWKRECSILNTLLDIQRRKQTQRSVLARLLARKNDDHVNNYADLRDGESKTSNIVTGVDVSLSQKELDALIHIAAQNVQILREDAGDVVELLNKCKV